MDRRRFLASFAGLGTLICLAPGRAVAGEDAALSDFAGTWRYVGGDKEKSRAQQSIDECVEALPMFKNIARQRLEESCMPLPMIGMKADGQQLSIIRPGVRVIRGEANGSAFKWKNPYGDTVNVKIKLSGRTLKVRFYDGASDTRKSYVLADDGSRFVVKVHISHERMPVPVDYRYTYSREG